MKNIRSIYNGAAFGEPNEDVIQYLEDLLERAKNGEVVGTAVAALHKGEFADFKFVGKVVGFGIVGALEIMKTKIIDQI